MLMLLLRLICRSVSKNFQLAARQILDIVYSTTIIGRKIDVLSFSPRLATQLGKLEVSLHFQYTYIQDLQ